MKYFRNLFIISILGTCFGLFLYAMAPKVPIEPIPYVQPIPTPHFDLPNI